MRHKNPPAPQVELELWRDLYRAALEFQVLAPWNWVSSDDVLSIDNEHGVRILSILGGNREVFGLAAYRGTDGANILLLMRSPHVEFTPDSGYHHDALLLDFVPQSVLDAEDKRILKNIEFHPARVKPKLCPLFRSLIPGYVPWFIDQAEVRQMLDNLRGATLFANLLRAHPNFFQGRGPTEIPFFPVDAPMPLQPEQLAWHSFTLTPVTLDPALDPQSFQDLPAWLRLPQPAQSIWEIDAIFSSARIMQSPRPYWARTGLVADAHSGLPLGMRSVDVQHTLSDAAGASLASAMERQNLRPATLHVKSDILLRTLAPLAEALGITLTRVDRLPKI
jgi:hypothetical protein